ncbi:ribokinase [Microbacterium sp. LMI1-1-1.1]|uniref:ribokinase n=1 Tax=Microbacterium sp. LMI1-1-1.1 TaxID=3135223 RepID=UPI003466421B
MTSLPEPTVVVVGSINVDQRIVADRLPLPGETLIASSMTLSPGGKGANQAVAAARRGIRTVMVGAVGDDGRRDDALQVLADAGVELDEVRTATGTPTGLAVVTVAETVGAENTIVVVPGANGAMTAAAIDASAGTIARAAVVVAQGEIPVAGIDRLAEITLSRFLLNLAPVVDVDERTLRRADPLVVNEHEARLLRQRVQPGSWTDDDAGADLPRDAAAAAALLAFGIPSVVITRGAAGALVTTDDGIVHIPAPRVQAVDTTGAGDAFVGALAGALAAGVEMTEAVRQAVRVAAHAVTSPGTQTSYPTADTVLPPAAAGERVVGTEAADDPAAGSSAGAP